MLTLELATPTQIPLEVEGILPEKLRGLSANQIAKLPLQHGNRQVKLGEFFRVTGDASDESLLWQGNLDAVHWIGTQMVTGSIRIEGNVGRHVGSEMRGGTIEVLGNAGDWLGAQMQGGLVRVHGSAGNNVAGAYRGSLRGMTGGTILVDGSAGHEVAHSQRRGLIAIGGDVGDYAAINMLAGTLIVGGRCGLRPGAGMRRGTLIFLGPAPTLLPTFVYGCRYQPSYLQLLRGELHKVSPTYVGKIPQLPLDLYHGDMLYGGRGEVLIVSPT